MAKREFIEKDIYLQAQKDIENCLKIAQIVAITNNNAREFNIKTSLPNERIIFIDKSSMAIFKKVKDLDIRNYKLINYGKVAINLSFNTKHKYIVKKNVNKDDIELTLRQRINDIEEEIKTTKIHEDIERLFFKKLQLQEIAENIDSYEFCISNYYKYYEYSTVSYRFESSSGKLESENSHLIKDVRNPKTGQIIQEKYNLIFVDTEKLTKHIPYQNKKVEQFLEGFSTRLENGTNEIFIKKKL